MKRFPSFASTTFLVGITGLFIAATAFFLALDGPPVPPGSHHQWPVEARQVFGPRLDQAILQLGDTVENAIDD